MIFSKISKVLSSLVKRCSYCFSAMMLLLAVFGSLFGVNTVDKGLKPTQMLMCFAFSFIFSVVFCASDFIKNAVLRRTSQYVFTMAGVYLIFISDLFFDSFTKNQQNPVYSSMMLLFIATIIYVFIGVVYLAAKFIVSKIEKRDEEYKEVYKKTKTN